MIRVPAECFPLGVILQDEMKARGWSSTDVAVRMANDVKARAIWELTVDLLVNCSDTPMVVGQETADALGRAFGVAPQFFINVNDSYQAWRKAGAANESKGGRSDD